MKDLQILVKQTSNPSILQMQKRLHDEVVSLGKQALEWKANCEALQLALETERDAANLYAKQVAHWMHKHDELLAQQVAVPEPLSDGDIYTAYTAATIQSLRLQDKWIVFAFARAIERAHGIGDKQ